MQEEQLQNENSFSDVTSDADLISRVRFGDDASFGVLFERHSSAAKTVARNYLTTSADVDDVVAEAYAKILATLKGGKGPNEAFRAYLFTVVRRLSYEMVNGQRKVVPSDEVESFERSLGPLASSEDPALRGFEDTIVAQAYKKLPERWQTVLWYTEVEQLSPAKIAPILGLTANSAAALAYRAREGLRQAYLQQHLAQVAKPECEKTNSLLGAYVRGGLGKREVISVEKHLNECSECNELMLELRDVSHGMRVIVAPLVLGVGAGAILGAGIPLWVTLTAGGTGAVAGASGLATNVGATSAVGGGAVFAGSGAGAGAGGTASGGGVVSSALGGLAGLPGLAIAGGATVLVAAGVTVAAFAGAFSGSEQTPAASAADIAQQPAPNPSGSQNVQPSAQPTDQGGEEVAQVAPSPNPSGGKNPEYNVTQVSAEQADAATQPTTEPVSPTPTPAPSVSAPEVLPSAEPTVTPTTAPSITPTVKPTVQPTVKPSVQPTVKPSVQPTVSPTVAPTQKPQEPQEPVYAASTKLSNTTLTSGEVNVLEFQVENTGEDTLVGAELKLGLPSGITVTENNSATHKIPSLKAGEQITVKVEVFVAPVASGVLSAQVLLAGKTLTDPTYFAPDIQPRPEVAYETVIEAGAPLVAGQSGILEIKISNTGTKSINSVTALTIEIPKSSGLGANNGVSGTIKALPGTGGSGYLIWTCNQVELTNTYAITCLVPAVKAGEASTFAFEVNPSHSYVGQIKAKTFASWYGNGLETKSWESTSPIEVK